MGTSQHCARNSFSRASVRSHKSSSFPPKEFVQAAGSLSSVSPQGTTDFDARRSWTTGIVDSLQVVDGWTTSLTAASTLPSSLGSDGILKPLKRESHDEQPHETDREDAAGGSGTGSGAGCATISDSEWRSSFVQAVLRFVPVCPLLAALLCCNRDPPDRSTRLFGTVGGTVSDIFCPTLRFPSMARFNGDWSRGAPPEPLLLCFGGEVPALFVTLDRRAGSPLIVSKQAYVAVGAGRKY